MYGKETSLLEQSNQTEGIGNMVIRLINRQKNCGRLITSAKTI